MDYFRAFLTAPGPVTTSLAFLDVDGAAGISNGPIGGSSSVPTGPFPVPDDVGLFGLTMYCQWLILDGVNALGGITSDGARFRIGRR